MAVSKLSYDDIKVNFDLEIDNIDSDGFLVYQKRIELALEKLSKISSPDHNLYISGDLSRDDKYTVIEMLKNFTQKSKAALYDYCYVNNFKNPKEPKVIKLAPSEGKEFAKCMDELVDYLTKSVPRIFDSKEYEEKVQEVVRHYDEINKKLYEDLQKKANELDFTIKFSQMGIIVNPVIAGRVITEREYANLSDEIKKSIEEKRKELEKHIDEFLDKTKELEKEKQEKLKKINDEMSLFVVSPKIDEIRNKFKGNSDIEEYLDDVEDYTLKNISIFLPQKNQQFPFFNMPMKYTEYRVNLFVDNSQTKDVPVVYEENPTYYNVFGKLEKQAYFGAFITDFTHIISGSIHKANGGYLLLDAFSVLVNPGVWDTLKKSLSSRKSVIEEWSEKYGIIASETLKPQPIDLNLKIILFGPEYIYDILFNYDEEFRKLFKIKTNFDYSIPKEKNVTSKYVAKVIEFCKKNNLKIPNKDGFRALLKYSSKLVEDRKRLWAYTDDVLDIVKEAQTLNDNETLGYNEIKLAIEERIFLKSLWREKIYEMIQRGQIIIDFKGKKVGQINGLSVLDLGDFSFGRPNKILARTYLGKEGVVSIERESKLSGKIFDKSSFIISGYINGTYGFNKTLSFSASLSFEQSYSMIDGDSASVAEALAILSALSGIELKQNLAITGSMDQSGIVQPIGGVNEKIEGFYEVCKITGNLEGAGVVIPSKNIDNLVLNDEVEDAVKKGIFHLYTIDTIDDAIEIFTDLKAGKRSAKGFEKGSFHYLVDRKLKRINEMIKKENQEE
ncbi:Lon protease family protein [Hippea maritima]|uniref:endopeptidase La n=1 Tax=Hippea maritima (strain ATCC 700847 / DSM 10411 / MH2) TaxID=760142 RepID=F2LVI6_HIPMA|nr:ATP-binding protein [Hippea maritima]AEA33770.1 ATP-dependent protease La [Hippea maritima DSM 10411]